MNGPDRVTYTDCPACADEITNLFPSQMEGRDGDKVRRGAARHTTDEGMTDMQAGG